MVVLFQFLESILKFQILGVFLLFVTFLLSRDLFLNTVDVCQGWPI